jgi:hypothetical protein
MKTSLESVQLIFPEACLNTRGKIVLGGGYVDRLLDGVPLSFDRRRYGQGGLNPVTYTWAHAFVAGEWVDLGDPWPCLNPPVKELRVALADRIARGPSRAEKEFPN